jgi:hypothetical protein
MTGLALALILAAAFIHASWNFLAKRVGGGEGQAGRRMVAAGLIVIGVVLLAQN